MIEAETDPQAEIDAGRSNAARDEAVALSAGIVDAIQDLLQDVVAERDEAVRLLRVAKCQQTSDELARDALIRRIDETR